MYPSTCGLVAMTSASHAEGRQFDPGQVYLFIAVHRHAGGFKMTAVGFEPTPLRNGAFSHRLRPLGQTVLRSSDRTHVSTRSVLKGLFLKEAPTGD